MPAIVENLVVEQGADYRHDFPATTDHGVARSLLGWTASGVVKQHEAGEVLHAMALATQPGKVVLTVPGAVSQAWLWRRARYEIRLAGPNGEQERHAAGEITVDPQLA